MKHNSFHQHVENTSKFLGTQGLFKTGREAVEFKASVNWVNCSELNRKHKILCKKEGDCNFCIRVDIRYREIERKIRGWLSLEGEEIQIM